MVNYKPKNTFRNFLFDSAIPSGIRLLIATFLILAVHFFITFVILSILLAVDYKGSPLGLFLLAGYGLFCWLFFSVSIRPLWTGWSGSRILVLLCSFLLLGYSGLWFYLGPAFTPLAFFFLLLGAISGLYITTGYAPKYYYRKRKDKGE
ncbi:MAG: hypothetical protein ACLFNN_00890 [Candidatus Paceibacterota bacterium]